ncbi:MAG: SdrD B-like domain-containing protein [Bacteroidia bacterium]
MSFYIFDRADLLYSNAEHKIEGVIYMDADGNQQMSDKEQLLPFVKLNIYTDLNDNQRLDEQDLQLASCLTDAEGKFNVNISHGRTMVARVRDPKHEIQTNTISGSVRVGESYISLGGDGGVSNLTTLRFDNIQFPKDAEIHHAFLRFRAAGNNHERPVFWIFGEKYKPESIETEDIDPYTEQSVLWECGNWKKDHLYQSPDLSKVIQVLMSSGKQSISLVVEGKDGLKEAYSSAEHAPQLVVHYKIPDHAYLLSIDPAYSSANKTKQSFSLAFNNHQGVQLAYPGVPPVCLAMTKEGRMASLNWHSGIFHTFPLAERPSIEATQLKWGQNHLYGLYQGKIGIVSVPQGGFQKLRIKHKSSFAAISTQATKAELWAIDQAGYVLPIDPITETVIEHPISLVGFAELRNQKILQLAVFEPGQKLFALVQSSPKSVEMWSINISDGEIESLGNLIVQGRPVQEVINLSALPSGKLLLVTGSQNLPELSNLLIEFNPLTMESKILKPFSKQLQMTQCGCLLAPPHHIEGQVFFDRNANGKQDEKEIAYPNIRLHLYEDQNQNAKLDLTDWLLQTLSTDLEGKYQWQGYASSQYLIELDTTSLPAGIASVGKDMRIVDFSGYLGGGVQNALNFSVNQSSRISQIHWARFQAQVIEDEVKVSWVTTQEKESGYYYIMRSEDGIRYETIGRIVARGPTEGMQEYEFSDQEFQHLQSGTAVYRVRWENVQGQSSYSELKTLSQMTDALRIELTPGPTRPLDLRYRSEGSGKVALSVINLAGQTVFQKTMITGPDWRQLQIRNDDWNAGIYYIQWDGPVESRMKKIVVQ